MFFRRRHPYYYGPPRGYYPSPYGRGSSGIFFLLIILVAVYFLQIKEILPSSEKIPFWFLALVLIAVFFLFKRRRHYY